MPSDPERYLVAAIKPWNHAAFHRRTPALPGEWRLVTRAEDVTPERMAQLAPRYIFFPHWSWRVPDVLLERFECVGFHMTDLPFGRGGSPLQNLIERGIGETKLSVLRMVGEMDAGPVYLRLPVNLDGRAQDIYERVADLCYDAIAKLLDSAPEPRPQTGEPTYFDRRRPEQSALPPAAGSRELYDHIRMLDAETYPTAFLDHGEHRIEFRDAVLAGGGVSARATICNKPESAGNEEIGGRQ